MKRLLSLLFILTIIASCSEKEYHQPENESVLYSVDSWESLGGQTLVLIDLHNTSKLQKNLKLEIVARNSRNKKFKVDTTLTLNPTHHERKVEILINTYGDIKDVSINKKF